MMQDFRFALRQLLKTPAAQLRVHHFRELFADDGGAPSWKAELLYIVTPPSTKMKSWSMWITSGGKYVGAAVLARTSCQTGNFRLQPGRVRSLYFAAGLLVNGHGESVVALRSTIMSNVCSLSEPSVVSSPITSRSISVSLSLSNFVRKRSQRRA